MACVVVPLSLTSELSYNSQNGSNSSSMSVSQIIIPKLQGSGPAARPHTSPFYNSTYKLISTSISSLSSCTHLDSPPGSTYRPSSKRHMSKIWAEASPGDFVSTSEAKHQETLKVGSWDSNGSFRNDQEFLGGVIGKAKAAQIPSLSITILGATGELARQKIFPALFALFYNGCLPEKVKIFGYSIDQISDEELQTLITENLTCRIDQQENCTDKIGTFLEKVSYEHGGYDICNGMVTLDERMKTFEGSGIANRIFYLAVSHDVIHDVANCVATNAQSKTGFTRLIFEKPFGYDRDSSAIITASLLSRLSEEQIYRIDDLLGKELIENLTVLRFSNLIFEPLWNRTFIRSVQVIYSEDWGIQNNGRYFDKHGILRDIVQSHILQTIALLAMEPPVSLEGEDIRNEKVKVLRSMRKLTLDDVVLGQYKGIASKDGKFKVPDYLDEPGVSKDSITPTFVAAVLHIDNGRWDGVPFLIKAGKGLIKHKVEIRIQFRHVPGNLYRERFGFNIDLATNELVLRVHPNEAIFLKVNNKVPGLGLQLDTSELNLLYKDKYDTEIPDSYERLILDVVDGDNHLFMRSDELAATWEILTPLLEDIEKHKTVPELYTFGGRGPVGAYYLGAKHGVRWLDD